MTQAPLEKVVLIILDGFGCRDKEEYNAVAEAKLPNIRSYHKAYPFTLIGASGEAVGLPEGQMGNSEVGHLNIGAGRTVYQDLTRIDKSIKDGDFFTNKVLLQAVKNAQRNGSNLHLMGLLSDGGVHSHIEQLFALIDLVKENGLGDRLYIHAILDGRDVPPTSAEDYIEQLENYLSKKGVGKVASVSGRYYPMDRDNRWERVQKAYNMYVYGQGLKATSSLEAVREAYKRGENDEFVTPTLVVMPGELPVTIKNEDSLIMFNFRPDRMRQITRSFLDKDLKQMDSGERPAYPFVATMTEYEKEFSSPIAYPSEHLNNTLGEWLSKKGQRQLRLAETEKYAHVTFFLNGGVEKPYPGEERCLIPSSKVATYDLQPEMSAPEIARRACLEIEVNDYRVMIVNFANADMVGHTGIMDATVKALDAVDDGVGSIVKTALANDTAVLITSDHGNAEKMSDNSTGKPHTAHTVSPVPLILIDGSFRYSLRDGGILADIAPTLLELCGLESPPEMTGRSLLVER